MDIQIDTREKQRAIRKIIKTFDDNGVKHFSSKLLVGDYMSLDNPRLIIDRKQNLQELCGNVCQQHERFKRELLKAIDAGIQLVILVEHGSDIQSLEDVWFWENPRKHEVRWRMVNGKGVNKETNSVHAQIDYLKQHMIHIHPSCVNTIKEIQQWKWKKDERTNTYLEEPVPFFDDAMAMLRYSIEEERKAKPRLNRNLKGGL